MTGRQSALALGLLLVANPAFSQGHARSRESTNEQSSGAAERHPDPGPAPSSASSHSSSSSTSSSAQDHAQPRGGGSSGGSSAGSHHPSSSSAGSSSSSGSSGGGGHDSGSFTTDAQRRHPRPGTGTGFFNDRRNVVVYGSPYYFGSYGYYPYDLYFGFNGYSPYYYSGFYGYSQGYYNRNRNGYVGSLRMLVEPPETNVYVDGYYAGIADDFDGLFQRLRVSPGRHDIALRLDGYQTQRLKVYVPIDETLKIHHKMVRGTGEGAEATVGQPDRYAERSREDEGFDPEVDDERIGQGPRSDLGRLRLEVRPTDASIYIDGEFRGTARRVLSLSLPPGRHRIEIVRPGYRTLEREVDLRPGRTEDVTVDLER